MEELDGPAEEWSGAGAASGVVVPESGAGAASGRTDGPGAGCVLRESGSGRAESGVWSGAGWVLMASGRAESGCCPVPAGC
ncbi:hypothetical protein DKG71_15500 [Streptomyces sp. NEAU-S7GS2]|nr:hypothetical protein DKG71_15500 [Streptomyces sp. NEAU-S7GS2]